MTEQNDKPKLLQAVELVLADPADIKREVLALKRKFDRKYCGSKPESQINKMLADKIISNYSYYAGFVGGATGLTGVVPGLGTVLATFGGATADAALSMKYQIEMTMALAVVYGHDIEVEEEKRLCLLVAGLGAINRAAKDGGKALGKKALVKVTQQHLKGATLVAVKEVFKKLGIVFTRKAVEKAIPFGVGVLVGFTANKSLTAYVGRRAKHFYTVSVEEV
ncbi:MAG: EcsC family protein [Rhodospirillales bacterium]|nr:EcsC family protein [Rhodospirillales bacterium]MDE0712886.1 EcsC family protein [Rhodospirillales bacterium]